MAKLFDEFTLKSLKSKNRILMAPMCMFISDAEGFPNSFHHTHYTARAAGQTGMILSESLAVEPRGRITMTDLGIWDDKFIDPLKQIVKDVKEYGSVMGAQINHAGRKAEVDEPILGPSPIRADEEMPEPREMDEKDIDIIVAAFGQAARRANEIGFDFLEIHGAHGYLISQFLSPETNKRADEYGKNRNLFLSRVLDEVHKYWPDDKPVSVRVSAFDFTTTGNTPEIMAELLYPLRDKFDLIHVSSGGVVRGDIRINAYAGYQVKMAEVIKAKMPGKVVATVGLLHNPVLAEEILQNSRADIISIGRGILHDPYWALHAATTLKDDRAEWPRPYREGVTKLIKRHI